jgi:lipopolysaccharide export system permease protein
MTSSRNALLEHYIQTSVLRTFCLAAAALTVLLSLLDFTDELGAVGHGHYRLSDAFIYILLTAPSRLLQISPIAMLLGCLLGLGALARHSELTAMQSLGIPAGRIILSLCKLAVPIILVLFLLAQFVIPPAQQAAQTRHDKSLTNPTGGFWARSGEEYLNVQGLGPAEMPQGIDIYAFAPDGSLASATHADAATVQPGGAWRLTSVTLRTLNPAGFITAHPAFLIWPAFVSVRQLRRLLLPPNAMPPLALYTYIRDLKHSGQPSIRYANALWSELSIPVALLAMILLAVPFVLGPPRAQSTGQQITTGGIIGIIFALSQQTAGYLTLLYNLPPALTDLTPSFLLTALSLRLLLRP